MRGGAGTDEHPINTAANATTDTTVARRMRCARFRIATLLIDPAHRRTHRGVPKV
jgi:hypothetical protein